jgi:hypothetical protein
LRLRGELGSKFYTTPSPGPIYYLLSYGYGRKIGRFRQFHPIFSNLNAQPCRTRAETPGSAIGRGENLTESSDGSDLAHGPEKSVAAPQGE